MKKEKRNPFNRKNRTVPTAGYILPLVLIFFFSPPVCHGAMSIINSKHNLSISGTGTIKATAETRVCIFCHTPHRAQSVGVLWNRNDSTATYVPYTSSTAPTLPGQPTGASRLCLSCHDGTIALGAVANSTVEIQMNQRFLNSGPAAIGTDLSDDHPVSFVYDTPLSIANPEYKDPSLLMNTVLLDANNELQCTACHDPHDNSNGKFLTLDNTASALCLTCHQPTGWTTCSHSLSSATWNGTSPDPWPHTSWTTVQANACENCHRPHSAGGHERILNSFTEEDNCYPCHNGNVASTNIETEFTKASVHPVTLTAGVHDPKEDFLTMTRHVECVDCHNPHQVNNTTATAPNVSGRLAGVSGVNSLGTPVAQASYLYEICFKCHGDSAQGTAPIPRQIIEINKRLQFDLSNPSYHPVEGPGANPNVPSLLPQYTTASVIYCTDCHNNDSGPGTGGTGPSGPHGSIWPYLLERRYETADNTIESPDTYALCYKCHNRSTLLSDASGFPHSLHVGGGGMMSVNAPCSACHDPHGINNSQGTAVNNAHLINFDTSIVSPNSAGLLKYESLGTFTGRCFLSCHGQNHNPKTY